MTSSIASTPLPRASKFTMLLSGDEREKLYELASADGVPASVYLRTLIRKRHREMAGLIEAKKPTKGVMRLPGADGPDTRYRTVRKKK